MILVNMRNAAHGSESELAIALKKIIHENPSVRYAIIIIIID